MDAVSIGIFMGAWFAIGLLVVAMVAVFARADRRDRRLRAADASPSRLHVAGRNVQVAVRRAQEQRVAGEQRVRPGVPTVFH